tara:strand:+ start:10479 stop:10847 length:369 start_codon:yes stop_codon:yes gene_type:complete
MAQGKGGGRPIVVFDDKDISQIEALAAVLNKEQIADYFGIDQNTLRAVEKRQPEVFHALKKGKVKAVAGAGMNLLAQSRRGITTATIFYLKMQGGKDWKENQSENTGTGNVVVQVVKPSALD